jgi:hypothetical protein
MLIIIIVIIIIIFSNFSGSIRVVKVKTRFEVRFEGSSNCSITS